MLSESDLYNSNTAPDVKVNPKSLGAMWINYSNGRHYICSNNTMNKNTWLDPIGQLTNEFNSDIENLTNDTNNRFNTINSNINKLTTDTNNSINGINSKIDTTNGNINNITKYMNSNVNSINSKINEINARIDSDNSKLEITETEITKITEKVNNIKSLGINQKWYKNGIDITRRPSIWYQNNTLSPIAITVTGYSNRSIDINHDHSEVKLYIVPPNDDNNAPDSTNFDIPTIYSMNIDYSNNFTASVYQSLILATVFGIVPPKFYYIVISNSLIKYWSELR